MYICICIHMYIYIYVYTYVYIYIYEGPSARPPSGQGRLPQARGAPGKQT